MLIVAGATAVLTFVPYREFTPISLWNTSTAAAGGAFLAGLVITDVTIGSSQMTKGEISADLYSPSVDRGHDIHWQQFNPNTPLRMTVRNDAAVDIRANLVIKGAAYTV